MIESLFMSVTLSTSQHVTIKRSVRLLSNIQVDHAITTLVRAFWDDPLIAYLLPNVQKREKVLPLFVKAVVAFGIYYGIVYTTPDVEGVAICFPPKVSSLNVKALYRSGVFSLPFFIGLVDFVRLFRLLITLDGHQHKISPNPHWYLAVLGVDPRFQKKGVGSVLIESFVRQAKKDNLSCYLETMNENNLAFYRKRGFHLVKKEYSADKKLPFWIMVYSG